MDQRMTHFPHEKWLMGQLKMLMKRSTSWQRTLQSKTGALINRHSTQSPTLSQTINIQNGCLAFNMQSGWWDDLEMFMERSKCRQGTRQSKVGVNWIIAPSTRYIWWTFRTWCHGHIKLMERRSPCAGNPKYHTLGTVHYDLRVKNGLIWTRKQSKDSSGIKKQGDVVRSRFLLSPFSYSLPWYIKSNSKVKCKNSETSASSSFHWPPACPSANELGVSGCEIVEESTLICCINFYPPAEPRSARIRYNSARQVIQSSGS